MMFVELIKMGGGGEFDQNYDLLSHAEYTVSSEVKGFNSREVEGKTCGAHHGKEEIRNLFLLVAEQAAEGKNEKSGVGQKAKNGNGYAEKFGKAALIHDIAVPLIAEDAKIRSFRFKMQIS